MLVSAGLSLSALHRAKVADAILLRAPGLSLDDAEVADVVLAGAPGDLLRGADVGGSWHDWS